MIYFLYFYRYGFKHNNSKKLNGVYPTLIIQFKKVENL